MYLQGVRRKARGLGEKCCPTVGPSDNSFMRIAICTPIDLNGTGGVEKHVLCLADALGELGYSVDVFGKSQGKVTDTFYELRDFRSERYDVIHTHSGYYGPRFLKMQLQRSNRQRFVHTLHTISADYLLSCEAWLNWRCYTATLVEGMWSRYADHVIAVSERIKNLTLKCFRVGSEKVSVIGNGYTPRQESRDARAKLLSRYGLSDETMLILFVGRGEDRVKGSRLVSECVETLWREDSKVRLLAIPGSGFNGSGCVLKTGPVAHERMWDYYQGADIFVNASLSEGFPLSVVEAMAAQLAVVAAAVGGIPEIVRDGFNGLLLERGRGDLTEKLRRLIGDEKLRAQLGANARESVMELTWDRIALQTAKVYEELF